MNKAVFVVASSAESARVMAALGKFHCTFEDALTTRNSGPTKNHNKHGIYLVNKEEPTNVRLATAQ